MKYCLLIPVQSECLNLNRIFSMIQKINVDYVIFCENDSVDNSYGMLTNFAENHRNVRVLSFKNENIKYISNNKFYNIAKNRQMLLEEARKLKDVDYFVFMDSDIIPSCNDWMEQLSMWKKDICSIKTKMIAKDVNRNKYSVICGMFKDDFGKSYFRDNLTGFICEAYSIGFGGVCLSRKVVQDTRVNFLPFLKSDDSEDYNFCLSAQNLGYKIYIDNVLQFEHKQDSKINRSWRETINGEVIYTK